MDELLVDVTRWFSKGFLVVGLYTCIGIAIDRYWAISYPFSYRSQSSRKFTMLIIIMYWSLGFSNGSLAFIDKEVYRWFCLVTGLISVTVFVTLNLILYCKMKKRATRPQFADRKMNRDIQLTKTIGIVLLVYFLLYCPFFIVEFLYKLCHFETIIGIELRKIRVLPRILIILNCVLNSIIYAYRVKPIRDRIKEILKCSRDQSSVNSSRPSEFVSSSIRINQLGDEIITMK